MINSSEIDKDPSFPFGLRWAKIGEEYLLYGNVVMIPYSCINANSTNKWSFKFVGVGKLWA